MPSPRVPRLPRIRRAGVLRPWSSLASRVLEDPIGDDAELDLGRAGVDRLGARLQIDRLEAAARHLDRRKLRQGSLLEQLEGKRGKALMGLAPIEFCEAAARTDLVAIDERLDGRLDMGLEHLDLDRDLA